MQTQQCAERNSLLAHHVPRPRLVGLLANAKARAIVLLAPAGYGKTTLALEWLHGTPRALWYQTGTASADVAALALGIANAIGDRELQERVEARVKVSEAPEDLGRSLAQLVGLGLRQAGHEWLILDDYHLLSDSRAAEDLAHSLIEMVPIRLLITTRVRPHWATARRLLTGDIIEISEQQLAMTDEEAAQALEALPAHEARDLVERTDGWPALIGLAAASGRRELPHSRLTDTLYRYLAEEVFRHQPPVVQAFLLRASILPVLDSSYTEVVLQTPHPTPVIERLRSEGLAAGSLNNPALHPLFRDFLQRKFYVERPDEAVAIRRRAAKTARQREMWEAAFEVSLEAGHLDEAAEIIEAATPALLERGLLETLERWIAKLPTEIRRTPELSLVRGELELRSGRFSAALAIAEELLQTVLAGDARAWLMAGRAAHLVADEERALAYHTRARELAQDERSRREAQWGALSAAGALESDDTYAHLAGLADERPTDVDGRLRLAIGRQIVAGLSGSFAEVLPGLDRLHRLARHADNPLVRTNALSAIAVLNVSRAAYAKAQTVAEEGIEYSSSLHLTFVTPFIVANRAAAEIGLRQLGRARSSLAAIAETRAWAEDPYLQTDYANLQIKLALAAGEAVIGQEEWPAGDHKHRGIAGERLALLALGEVALGDLDAAKRHAREAAQTSRTAPAQHLVRWAQLAIRGANSTTDPSRLAFDVGALLEATIKAGCADAFVVGYRACPGLLRLATQSAATELVLPLVTEADDWHLAHQGDGGDHDRHFQRSLTRREEEVFHLIGEGLSNHEIARRLCISHSTAKVHVRNVLRKLGVATRYEAIAKASRA